jgi:hypothetical protein
MIKLKRILRYLFYTIKENRGKTIMILCAIALLYPIFNCNPDLKKKVKVITSFKYDTNTCYVYYGSDGLNVLKFDKEQPISPDGYLTKDKDNVWLILSWFGFVVLCIGLLVATFHSDDDFNWGFTGRWSDVLHRDIVCEFEDGLYYYILDNKLLCKSDTQMTRLYDNVNRYMKYPNLFLEYKGTKQQKRNNKLDKILSDV